MNYRKHLSVFGIIALAGFVVLWFNPQIGAAIFLPALGACLGALRSQSQGPAQPKPVLWAVFFVLVAIGMVIRYLFPDENFGGFEAGPEALLALWAYQGVLAFAFPLFGYLAYRQRVGRTSP